MRSLFFLISLLLPVFAFAQFSNPAGDSNPFTLSLSPQYIAPFSTATLSVQSDSLDLVNATMSVTVDGKSVYQGNVHPAPIAFGKAGSVTKIEVTLSINGSTYTQSLSVQPQDVALIIEPVSSAPPLYLGKPSVPQSGDVRIVAVANVRTANGSAIDPSSLSYLWTVDDTQIDSSSGIGRSSVLVAVPLLYRSRTVSVSVSSQDSKYVGGDSLSLSPQDPTIRIYENDPLLGIRFGHALTNTYAVTGAESTLYAAPFSLPITNGSPLLEWSLNGTPAQTGQSITLRPNGAGAGSASLSVSASAQGQSTTASAYLSLTFGTTNTNAFGL